jgi:hypothetical protein
MEYDIIEYLKKRRANISIMELGKIAYQRKLLQDALNKMKTNEVSKKYLNPTLAVNHLAHINTALTGQKSKSKTPPFLLSFEIFNQNVHNFLVDYGAS